MFLQEKNLKIELDEIDFTVSCFAIFSALFLFTFTLLFRLKKEESQHLLHRFVNFVFTL